MKNSILILLFFIFLFTASCKKEETPLSQLPKPTTEGRNIFGCLVNGEVWTPAGANSIGGIPKLRASYEDHIKLFNISAKREITENGINQFMAFGDIINGVGEYTMTKKNIYTDFNCAFYHLDTLKDRVLRITHFEPSNRIISGTFEFSAISTDMDCPDTIQVTEGRFDITY